jgi:predicted nucleic acid-binding protein
MAAKTEAYVDTSALIAFADRSDSYHHLFRRAFSDPPALITTPLVISEGQAWFVRRFDSYRGLEFISMVESMTFLKLIAVGKKEMTAGAAILRRFSDQDLTLVAARVGGQDDFSEYTEILPLAALAMPRLPTRAAPTPWPTPSARSACGSSRCPSAHRSSLQASPSKIEA